MARDDDPAQWIVPTRGAKTLPAVEILTGRGFVTGKSGSGKSNTASVIAEELLANGYNLLIVDPEGEYYGLKEQFELLHVGNDDTLCDVTVGPEHAERIAAVAIEENVPVILDVSDYLDGDEAKALIADVVRHLYVKEKEARKPFLLMVEEMQEYLPQQGGGGDLGELLERVAKRGRKRGLGMLGMSQRPSSVDKDFITQCDWMVWHRLTWKTDLDVVRNILGSDVAEQIEDLETGEGFLMTDWDDEVEKVQFKKKRTHDAGATPGLESYDRPDLKSVSDGLLAEITDSPPQTQETLAAPAEATLDDAATTDEAGEAMDGVAETPDGADTVAALDIGGPDTDAPMDDLEALDRAELEELARDLHERAERAERAVADLRSQLQTRDEGSPGGRTTPTGQRRRGKRGGGQPTPRRPTPPSRPPDRSGVSGTLVEFTAMLLYLWKVLVYRVRLLGYRLRVHPGERQRPDE